MKKILLVDDDAELVEALLRDFRPTRQEWQVTTAKNGVEALCLARGESFDLLVTDIFMPEKDGIETIVAFRREYPSVKIVAMSDRGQHLGTEPLHWARVLGADATLEKPFAFDVLRNTIRSLLDPESDLTSSPEEGV